MPHPHGTINRYNNQRCRCDLCRAAIRDYRRTQRATTTHPATAPDAPPPGAPPHTPRTSTTLDRDAVAKAMIGGHLMWNCGHVNTWHGVDVARARVGPYSDPSRYPCGQCGAVGIVGTVDPHERPDVPRA
jgi:hypothetical protein